MSNRGEYKLATIMVLVLAITSVVACDTIYRSLPRRPRAVTPTTVTLATPVSPPARLSPVASSTAELASGPDNSIQIFAWGSGELERDMRLAREGGFSWVKQMFQWNHIEGKEKGKFEWNEPDRILAATKNHGLKVIARIDYSPRWAREPGADPNSNGPPSNLQDFADFMFALASRYRTGSPYGTIQAYQIWNEPNLDREWGMRPPNPDEYIRLLKVGYEAIKAADSQALVISAGMSPTTTNAANARPDTYFVEAMYKSGSQKYFDMLGVHGSGFKAAPEMAPEAVGEDPKYNHGEKGLGRIYCFRHVEDIRAIMEKYGDGDRRMAILEYGWTSDPRPDSAYKWHAVTEEEKADYIVRAMRYARGHWRPWMAVMSLIFIASPNWTENNEQYHWAITLPNGSVRPSYLAVKNYLRP